MLRSIERRLPAEGKVRNPLIQWEFLLSASRNSLQSYELSRLSHASNLRNETATLVDQWMEENTCAMLARWLMEHRERETQLSEAVASAAQPSAAACTASDNF